MKRGRLWDTWQRRKDTIKGDIQLRLPSSSHLPWPVAPCVAMLAAPCLDALMGRGQDAPVYEKQEPVRLRSARGG